MGKTAECNSATSLPAGRYGRLKICTLRPSHADPCTVARALPGSAKQKWFRRASGTIPVLSLSAQLLQKTMRSTSRSNAGQAVIRFSAATKPPPIEIAAATTSAATVALSNRDAFPVRWSSANSQPIEAFCSVAGTERSTTGNGPAKSGPLVGCVGSWQECFAGLTGMRGTCAGAVAFALSRSAGTTTARVSGFGSTIVSFILSLSNSNHGYPCLPKFFFLDEHSRPCATAADEQSTYRFNAATRIAKLRRRSDIREYPTAAVFVSIVLIGLRPAC